VDNQGIQPILLANERMARNAGVSLENNLIDLVLISDVASPSLDDFKASKQDKKGWWKKLTPGLVISGNWLLFFFQLLLLLFLFYKAL